MQTFQSTILNSRKTKKAIIDAAVSGIEIIVFAYFISFPYPYKIIALIPLLVAAFLISRHFHFSKFLEWVLPKNIQTKHLAFYCLIGLLLGVASALFYRGSQGMPLFISFMRPFLFVSVFIGFTEELYFRGFLQTQLNQWSSGSAILFTALINAMYKAALFLSPTAPSHENLMFFFLYSFAAFIILGILRNKSNSLLPSIIAHAVFELMVDSELSQAPWWVW